MQADLRLGAIAVDRRDPRWADLTIASYAMGGAFLSRLNAVLREERGYTYGVRLGFCPHRSGGTYAVQGSFRTEVVADAIREARELLDVDDAGRTGGGGRRRGRLLTWARRRCGYATADGVADQAASQVLGGLPTDYVDTSLAALREVTPGVGHRRVHAAWSTRTTASLVVVGDADPLAEPLRALGYDDLVVTEG